MPDSPTNKVDLHLLDNYKKDDETGEESWTTGRLPKGDPRTYHWRMPQCARTQDKNIGGKDGH